MLLFGILVIQELRVITKHVSWKEPGQLTHTYQQVRTICLKNLSLTSAKRRLWVLIKNILLFPYRCLDYLDHSHCLSLCSMEPNKIVWNPKNKIYFFFTSNCIDWNIDLGFWLHFASFFFQWSYWKHTIWAQNLLLWWYDYWSIFSNLPIFVLLSNARGMCFRNFVGFSHNFCAIPTERWLLPNPLKE